MRLLENAQAGGARVGLALDAEYDIHSGGRLFRQHDAVALRKHRIGSVDAGAAALAHLADEGLAFDERRTRAFLNERGRAAIHVLRHRAERFRDRGRMRQPADAPAGHRPGLREAVDGDDEVFRLGQADHRRRRFRVEREAVVHLVGNDPDARCGG